jgi:hypothetical protein
MKKSRYAEEQIVGALKESEAVALLSLLKTMWPRTSHYEGELYWKIWYEGKTFDAESGDPRLPKTIWCARVKRKNGSIGWVIASGRAFSNQDQCG